MAKAWSWAVGATSAVGLGVSLYLTRLHLDLFYGAGVGESLCDFGEGFNCSAVNASPESEIFGIPQSVLAIPAYLLALGLGVAGAKRREGASAVLLGLATVSVLYSARLAWVSATVIGAWCLFCMVLYGVNLALLGLGIAGVRPAGLAAAAKGAVGTAVAAAVVWGVAFGGTWLGYSHVRDGMAETAAKAAVAKPEAAAGPGTTAAKTAGADAAGETKKVRLGAAKADVKAPKDLPTRGSEKAPVTIVELGDFQCPFCKRLAGILDQLVEERPDDVKLVFVQYPLNLDCTHAPLKKTMHPEACNAAAAGVCAAKQGHFWEMHDALFERQGELNRKTYLSAAKDIGLDAAAFASCLDDPATSADVLAQTQLGADLGVTGTPTFYINGRQMAGAQPIEVLRAVVDAEKAGNKDTLDLDVAVGTEEQGAVDGPADVAVSALSGVRIGTFEASLDGKKAVSRPGVEPARSVSWYDAKAACEAAGQRLCTEREWLAACTGDAPVDADGDGIASNDDIHGKKYGYGDARRSGVCADSRNPDAPGDLRTGNHPKCQTPVGAYDMLGGVKEWVGLTPATAAVKGGSYSSGESARCAYFRDDIAPDTNDAATGFRCCSGPADPPAPDVVAGRDVGEKLASFAVDALAGGSTGSKAIAGHPALVTFWASWCGPCQKEMPALATLYEKYHAKGLEILAISVDSDDAKLDAWLKAHPMPFPIARDRGGELMKSFPNRGLPTTLWIRKDGTIRLRTTGVPPGAEKRLDELMGELVGG